MSGITAPKKIFTIAELRSLRDETNIPYQSPAETASYCALLANRLNDASKTTDRSIKPTKAQSVPIRSNIAVTNKLPPASTPSTIPFAHQIAGSNMQWRQPQQTFASDLRSPRSLISQKHGMKELTAKLSGEPGIIATRVNMQLAHNSENRNNEKERSTGQQSKCLSSAENQRLQFEKEREEIELNRQNVRKMSGSASDVVADSRGQRRSSGYHDACDLLMDELAGKSCSIDVTKSDTIAQSPAISVQSTGKSNMLMMAMGLGSESRTQPSPQGMKKISIDTIFSNTTVKNNTPIKPYSSSDHTPSSNLAPSSPFSYDIADNSSARKLQPSHEVNFSKKDSDSFADGSLIEADDDYEISMRLIERMICGDDDYDKDDKSTSYGASSKSQVQPLYSFFDAPPPPPPPPGINSAHAAKHAGPVAYMQQQSMSNARSPSGAPHVEGGVSLSIESLFETARRHELANNSGVSMSHQRDRLQNHQDTSKTTDVLLKLGFGAQTYQGSNGQDYPPDRNAYLQGSPQYHSTPQKSSSSYPLNTNSQSKEQGSSPFAFHSSSSGGGSSGGGNRRSIGTPTGSSSASTSSRQQLFKMSRVPNPNPTNIKTTLMVEKSPTPVLKDNQGKQVPVESPLKISNMLKPSLSAAAVVGKDSGMQRISISDLFKSSSKVTTPSVVTTNALSFVPATAQTAHCQSTSPQ